MENIITSNQLLAAGAEILSRETGKVNRGWTKGTLARNKQNGHRGEVPVTSPQACRFCSIGAINRAQHELGASSAVRKEAVKKLGVVMGGDYVIVTQNDHPKTTLKQVLFSFDLAQLQD